MKATRRARKIVLLRFGFMALAIVGLAIGDSALVCRLQSEFFRGACGGAASVTIPGPYLDPSDLIGIQR